MQEAQADTLGPPKTLSFRVINNAGRTTKSKETQTARGSSAAMERERDDRRRLVSDEEDDSGRGRGHGGWYGDPEGHAEAARQRRR